MAAESPKFVSYIRVSTARQGRSGLGMDAQREAVRQFVSSRGGKIIAPEFVEVETGKRDNRPELQKALKRCRITGAMLVVAKLDRLSRNAAFLLNLQAGAVPFVAADMPDANETTVGIMAVIAQQERKAISQRTKDALAAAKARKVRLGGRRAGSPRIADYTARSVAARREMANQNAERVREAIEPLQHEGLSLNAMAARLNADSVTTSRGGAWTATAVKRALERLGLA